MIGCEVATEVVAVVTVVTATAATSSIISLTPFIAYVYPHLMSEYCLITRAGIRNLP